MADPRDGAPPPKDDEQKHDPPQRPDAKRRFARAMARAEFGRFYWDEAAEQALRAALKRKHKR